mgnify:CR=1 FL=1
MAIRSFPLQWEEDIAALGRLQGADQYTLEGLLLYFTSTVESSSSGFPKCNGRRIGQCDWVGGHCLRNAVHLHNHL